MPAFKTNLQVTEANWRELVQEHVESLNYGSVEIVIHDSRIVHIDTTQRLRLSQDRPSQRNAIAAADQRVQFRRAHG